ncbi:hypothetical protein ACIBIZ_24025 [Nonomuraea spiralis]|uniref:hypothetical protein n=1 Tax=Nonomuraea spiralis TaxID=46182 RepID=UPI0037A1DEE6
MGGRMHVDEADIDEALVRRLLTAQFPRWAELGADDAMWARGRGRALSMALIQLPYYKDTNPAMAANARHVIGEVLGGPAR